jgi:hypothetical protein
MHLVPLGWASAVAGADGVVTPATLIVILIVYACLRGPRVIYYVRNHPDTRYEQTALR